MELRDNFQAYIVKKNLVRHGQKVLLAVSGGVDSMVLADLLLKAGIAFGMAHCNFKLRGNDADMDEQLARDWAAKHGIPFYHTSFDTKQRSEEWKKGIQETARILRYEWLDEIRVANGYSLLSTAHHANDNAETLLINLFKGTGIAGLHGIQPKNNSIIRPLLFATKEEIRAYAAANDVPFREDVSNTKDDYLRNAVRLNIVPAIEGSFPNAVQHANASIERFAQAEELYRKAVEAERKKLVEKRGQDIYIPILKLQKASPLETIAYELFTPYGFTSAQVPEILKLLASESGHYISSASHRIIRNRDFLVLTLNQTTATDILLIEGVPCVVETEGRHFNFSVEKKSKSIPTDANIACIDMRRITFPLVLRKWRIGDYFYPLGMGMKKKKLSKYFIDQKVAVHEKEQAWVLECDKRIAWIAGMRLDERFKIKPDTEQVLRIEVKPR